MPGMNGANDFTMEELDELFASEIKQETPPVVGEQNVETATKSEGEPKNEGKPESDVDTTKAFAHRLKESTEKARQEERDAIAKSLGYESYTDMQNKREAQMLKDKELDPEQVMPIVEELVKKRMDQDPRIKELEEVRKQRLKEFGERELAEIKQLTGGEISSFSQLSKEVVELWKTKGSLKAAYLELEGEKLITKIRSENSKGSTQHLASPSAGAPMDNGMRLLTDQEKVIWKKFNPNMTEDELNKQLVKK